MPAAAKTGDSPSCFPCTGTYLILQQAIHRATLASIKHCKKSEVLPAEPAHCNFTFLTVLVSRWTGKGRKLTNTLSYDTESVQYNTKYCSLSNVSFPSKACSLTAIFYKINNPTQKLNTSRCNCYLHDIFSSLQL